MNSNLIPFDQMGKERHRELSAKGGRASGETRRRKAAFRRAVLEHMQQQAIKDDIRDDFDRALDILFKQEWSRQRDAQRKRKKREATEGEQRERGVKTLTI